MADSSTAAGLKAMRNTYILQPVLVALLLAVAWLHPASSRAEVFLLANKGQVRGEVVPQKGAGEDQIVVKTSGGFLVTLDRAQIVDIIPQSPAAAEYDKIAGNYPDTAEGQWQLAEWCKQNGLPSLRKRRLERVVELDEDHEPARRALGYSHVEGKWVTQSELMTERGFRMYKGKWRLPQEIDLMERRGQDDRAAADWFMKLRRWREWLTDERAVEAAAAIRQIEDPYAVGALSSYLKKETSPDVRELYIEGLARVGTPGAMSSLVNVSIYDPVEEVRLTALDYLKTEPRPDAVALYIQGLKSPDNAVVNRAAVGLAEMKDHDAVGPLIDALVTIHKFKVQRNPPGSTSASFPTGGSGGGGAPAGLSMGGGPVVIRQPMQNPAVLDALVNLTGVNFDFDVRGWKAWLASRKQSEKLDARRD